MAQWLSPMVQTVLRTIQISQSLVDKVVAAPVTQVAGLSGRAGRRHSCRDTEADPHGLSDHGDSPVAWRCGRCPYYAGRSHARCVQRQVVDIPVVTQRLFPMVQFILQTPKIHQLQSIDKVFDVPVCRSSSFLVCSL